MNRSLSVFLGYFIGQEGKEVYDMNFYKEYINLSKTFLWAVIFV